MCDFISWIEVKDKVGKVKNYYLTGNQVFDTPRGQMLRDWCQSQDDYVGHGAIRFYYELDSGIGKEKECTDFSSTDKFPPEIVADIKAGKMRGLGTPEGLLTLAAWIEYDSEAQSAWEEYDAKKQTAWDEYDAKRQTARDEYEAKRQTARDEYETKTQAVFWDMYADVNNRAKAWR